MNRFWGKNGGISGTDDYNVGLSMILLHVQAYYAKDDDETKVEDVGDAESKAKDDAENAEPKKKSISVYIIGQLSRAN